MAITLCGPAFQQVHLASGLVTLLTRSYNPTVQAPWFGLFRFRSPLLPESLLFSFPPGTEMVHFPGLASLPLWIQRRINGFQPSGFSHSEIPGSKLACNSPRLIAACHVLLRLHVPRHPPYALSSLTIKLTQRIFHDHRPHDRIASIRLTESLLEAARQAKDATSRLTCICPKNFHCQRAPRLNFANLGLESSPLPRLRLQMLSTSNI